MDKPDLDKSKAPFTAVADILAKDSHDIFTSESFKNNLILAMKNKDFSKLKSLLKSIPQHIDFDTIYITFENSDNPNVKDNLGQWLVRCDQIETLLDLFSRLIRYENNELRKLHYPHKYKNEMGVTLALVSLFDYAVGLGKLLQLKKIFDSIKQFKLMNYLQTKFGVVIEDYFSTYLSSVECLLSFNDSSLSQSVILRTMRMAAQLGHNEVIRLLYKYYPTNLNKDKIIQLMSQAVLTPLHFAAMAGHFETFALLIDLETDGSFESLSCASVHGLTTLHYATLYNKQSFIEKLFEKYPSFVCRFIGVVDKQQRTILHVAASKGHFELLKLYLDALKKYPELRIENIKSLAGLTALEEAYEAGKFICAHLMLEYENVDINAQIAPGISLLRYNNDHNLRDIGCLESRMNQEHRIVQNAQGVHGRGIEESIQMSIENLKNGVADLEIEDAYQQFLLYIKETNLAFIDDLKAIPLDKKHIFREHIILGLENKSLETKVLTFLHAIKATIKRMELNTNSKETVQKFRERCGLIWIQLTTVKGHKKIYELQGFMEAGDFESRLQKVRLKFFIQLIETQFEYKNVQHIDTQSERGALVLGGPACAEGTSRYIISCFSNQHEDINVSEVSNLLDYNEMADLKSRIIAKLPDIIEAVCSEKTIANYCELIDRMAGVSSQISNALLPQHFNEFLNAQFVPFHSRVIGKWLGSLKLSFPFHIIDGIRDNESTMLYVSIEDAILSTDVNQLVSYIIQAKKQFFQNQIFKVKTVYAEVGERARIQYVIDVAKNKAHVDYNYFYEALKLEQEDANNQSKVLLSRIHTPGYLNLIRVSNVHDMVPVNQLIGIPVFLLASPFIEIKQYLVNQANYGGIFYSHESVKPIKDERAQSITSGAQCSLVSNLGPSI